VNDADAQFRLWQARLARIDEDMAQARARRPPGAGSARDPATIDLLSRIERDRAALARAIDGLRGSMNASSGALGPTAGRLERLGLQIERALGAVLERP
jgi:hypothetical protein